jgi:hypothetical protein
MLLGFVGPPPLGSPEAPHRNDVHDDNRLENLYWASRSENLRDQVRNGKHPLARRTHCVNRHEFTPENTRMNPNGGRLCRQCERDKDRRWKRRNRASAAIGAAGTGEP